MQGHIPLISNGATSPVTCKPNRTMRLGQGIPQRGLGQHTETDSRWRISTTPWEYGAGKRRFAGENPHLWGDPHDPCML